MSKTIMITGATVNTGYAIAKKFAENGYCVVITSRRKEAAEAAASEIAAKYGVKTMGCALDMTDTESIRHTFCEVKSVMGGVDVFVANSADLGMNCGIMNTDEKRFDEITNTNIRGTFFCCQEAARQMMERGGGSIVTIGSVQGTGAIRGRAIYSLTKAAISVLVKNMAFELGEYGIRANNIVAGAIHSDRWNGLSEEEIKARRSRYPVGRESTEEEIANAAFYLGTDLSASVTGIDLTVDSGISVCILPYQKEN